MNVQDVTRAFEAWRVTRTRPAWKPAVGDTAASTHSWFGGSPIGSADDSWPSCAECDQPMRFVLQLDLAELPAELDTPRDGALQFFYCSTDDGLCETWNPFSGTHALRVVPRADVPLAPPTTLEPLRRVGILGWNAIQDLPSAAEHELLGIEYDYDFDKGLVDVHCPEINVALNGLDIDLEVAEAISNALDGDKLGGWPHWVQGVEYPACPSCGESMDLLMQIDSNDNLDLMFGDAGCGHITRCRKHPEIIAFGWACG